MCAKSVSTHNCVNQCTDTTLFLTFTRSEPTTTFANSFSARCQWSDWLTAPHRSAPRLALLFLGAAWVLASGGVATRAGDSARKVPFRVLPMGLQLTRPIASRAKVHGFESPDGEVTVVAWQRTSVAGDGRREVTGQEPPRPAEELILRVPGRRLRLVGGGTGSRPPIAVLEVTPGVLGISVRLSVAHDCTLSFRLVR
jgi:hypothetical protein